MPADEALLRIAVSRIGAFARAGRSAKGVERYRPIGSWRSRFHILRSYWIWQNKVTPKSVNARLQDLLDSAPCGSVGLAEAFLQGEQEAAANALCLRQPLRMATPRLKHSSRETLIHHSKQNHLA